MRYLPLTKQDREEMLSACGVSSVDEFFKDVPDSAFFDGLADLPMHQGEMQVESKMTKLANQNLSASNAPFFFRCGLL